MAKEDEEKGNDTYGGYDEEDGDDGVSEVGRRVCR